MKPHINQRQLRCSTAVARFLLLSAITALSAGLSLAFDPGDQVALTRDAALLFHDQKLRDGKTGEAFSVLTHRRDTKRVYLDATDSAGKQIALAVPEDAVALVPADAEKARMQATSAIKMGKYAEAERIVTGALRTKPEDAELLKILEGLPKVQAASQQLVAARERLKRASLSAAQKRKNAAIADRSNPLNPKDESGRERAEQMRADATQMEQSAKEAVQAAAGELENSLAALGAHGKVGVGSRSTRSSAGELIAPTPGVALTPAQEAHNRMIAERRDQNLQAELQRASAMLRQWTEDEEDQAPTAAKEVGGATYRETMEFINRKLKPSERRMWFGKKTGKMILESSSNIVVFDPASCSPEVRFGTKQERREHARYPMAGSGQPPIMDKYVVDLSQLQIATSDGRELIEFHSRTGETTNSDNLFLNWQGDIDAADLEKLANALSHLMGMFGGKKSAF